jgi:hypothetical protein
MTDTYLRSLGFAPTVRTAKSGQQAFSQAWRYQFDHLAADGTPLFIEHPLGIATCRLSTVEAPLTAEDIFASIDLHDRPALATAMTTFYAAHGGMGTLLPSISPSAFQPFRRQL